MYWIVSTPLKRTVLDDFLVRAAAAVVVVVVVRRNQNEAWRNMSLLWSSKNSSDTNGDGLYNKR